MKCEAEDSANKIICVATIIRVKCEKLHIHFDGWPKKWDFWTAVTSQKVHYVGWCADAEIPLCPPKGMFCKTNLPLFHFLSPGLHRSGRMVVYATIVSIVIFRTLSLISQAEIRRNSLLYSSNEGPLCFNVLCGFDPIRLISYDDEHIIAFFSARVSIWMTVALSRLHDL